MKYVLGGAVLILGVFLVVLSFIPLGIEPLTEVYFEDHTKLPKHIFVDQAYNFSFTIQNIEYQTMKYNYEILIGDVLLDSGEFVLENTASETVFQEFEMFEGFGAEKIVVNVIKDYSLEDPEFRTKLWWPDPDTTNEIDIHFWTNEIIGVTIVRTP